MVFDYTAKGSIERRLEVADDDACAVVSALRRRRSGGPNLFAYKDGRRWADVHAHDVNTYIKELAGEEFSAKDFRTWSATVLAAAALGSHGIQRRAGAPKRRAVTAAVKAVAAQLGNTPAVCRSSYVDPRIIDGFECGETIASRLARLPEVADLEGAIGPQRGKLRDAVEEAVIDLLSGSLDHGALAAA